MTTFQFAAEAEADVDSILAYSLAACGELQTRRYLDGLYELLTLLADNPGIGRHRLEISNDVRSHVHRQHVIFYLEVATGILVLRILHSRQDVNSAFSGSP